MTTPPSSEFSYDLYPGLDADLEAALARNIANGIADAGKVATSGLANAVSERLNDFADTEAKHWAAGELYNAAQKWHRYDLSPDSRRSLGQGYDPRSPNMIRQVEKLFEAKQDFTNSGYTTPEGTPIGETMKLIMVPWQHFKDHLDDIPTLLRQMRQTQGITNDDYLNNDLISAINFAKPMYQSPHQPGHLISALHYLDMKIAQDGAWGVMLAQTSNEAGLEHLKQQSPDQLTTSGGVSDNLRLKNIPVDSMGIFEWWAITLQEDPSQLSNSDYSWLLANRLDVNGVARVLCGRWDDGQVRSRLYDADYRFDDIRPRLAVM